MPLTADQRHALLLADRSRDVGQITVVIEHVFAANSDANLFDIELAFRDAACAAYVSPALAKRCTSSPAVCRRCWRRSPRPKGRR